MNIAILGAGGIARILADTMKQMEDVSCYAVASRDLGRSEAFAKDFGFEKAYGSYEEMLADEKVELVYIATPHSHHYEHMKLCIAYGKPVLCEKSFTVNEAQATEVLELAKEKGVLVAEAIWTRYMPSRKIINDLIEEGIIGEVRTLTANLHYKNDSVERIVKPELAGGALLDLGVYTLNFALMFFGHEFYKIASSVQITDTGVDGQNGVQLYYKDGRAAFLNSGIHGISDRQGIFYGTNGYMIVENINNPQKVTVYNGERQVIKEIQVPLQISGYEYQIQETIDSIQKGLMECPSMPHDEIKEVMRVMDGLRRDWGLNYPME